MIITIGDKIKSLRKERGIFQKELAEALSVSKSAVAMWETGNRLPDIETIKKIAEYFNVSTDYILDNEKSRNTPSEEDIKFALFDGSEGITDAMYDEVKQFAAMIKMREDAKRKGIK